MGTTAKAKPSISSRELEIDLASRCEPEYFKWFLACLLFGKPIQQAVAKRAYLAFVNVALTTPAAIQAAGWDHLVAVLDAAHYVRYDYSTATKVLDICRQLTNEYGTLTRLFALSHNADDLSTRLQRFKGIGPVTARIFLQDLYPILFDR
jgi:endonuclease III